MKTKNKKFSVAILALLGLSLASQSAFADSPSIQINNNSEELYVESGSKSSIDNAATYNFETNTLSLNNFQGENIIVSGLDNLTINLAGNNTLNLDTTIKNAGGMIVPLGIEAPNTTLSIGGDGKLVVNESSLDGYPTSAHVIHVKKFSLESADINISAPTKSCIAADYVTIKSGKITLKCNDSFSTDNVHIMDGSVLLDSPFSSGVTPSKNLIMSGGTLTANYGISLYGFMEIGGGEVNISGSSKLLDYSGIYLFKNYNGGKTDRYFEMRGGKLKIDNATTGIKLIHGTETSYVGFIKGEAIFNLNSEVVASIGYDAENSQNIIIDKGVNITPKQLTKKSGSDLLNKYVYSLVHDKVEKESESSDNKQDGGSAVIEDKDIAIPNTSSTDKTDTKETEKKSSVKSPDTGANTKDNSGLVAILTTIPLLAGIVASTRYYIKTRKSIRLD